MTPEEIMKNSEIKYNSLKKSGKWDTQDPHDAQIVALTTMLRRFIDQNTQNLGTRDVVVVAITQAETATTIIIQACG